jgi:hypothetical protein
VVFGEGGPKDVVQELGCATSFRTVDEAVEIIQSLLGDPAGSTAMSQVLKENSDRFSTSSFQTKVRRAIRDMGLTLPK